MAQDTTQARTEQATPRRREDARRRGQVPYSADLSTSFVLFISLTTLWFISPLMGSELVRMMHIELSGADVGSQVWQSDQVKQICIVLVSRALMTTGMLSGIVFVATLTIGASQAGLRFTFEPLEINWEKLNIASGWSRLLSARSAMRAAMAVAKAAVTAGVAWWVIRGALDDYHPEMSLYEAITIVWYAGLKLGLILTGMMLPLAIADYLFQRQRHEADLRMTRQEVIEEQRDDQVDPHLRARQRKMQRERNKEQNLDQVSSATVVVSNPTHFAVALKYERGQMDAPILVAKGEDDFAQEIMAEARKHGVPVLRRPPVARALYALGQVGQVIPDGLFQAVAEILAFVYKTRREG